ERSQVREDEQEAVLVGELLREMPVVHAAVYIAVGRACILRAPMQDAASLTPMFRQYRALKGEHASAILLFRMGDFYEMFFEDARLASRTLDLTLTARGKGTANAAPMCGFPHHQLDAYTAKLVRAGHRVAICDQVEDPRKAKGLVRREVVRIVT